MLRFLVVDDTRFMRKLLSEVLLQQGFEVAGEADNGAAAIQLYRELRPDVVFLDIYMPEMDGIEAMKQIRAIDPDAIVIVCSGTSQQYLISDAMKTGADGYVMKPFKPKQIQEVILKYVMPKKQLLEAEKARKQASIEPAAVEPIDETPAPAVTIAEETTGIVTVQPETGEDAAGRLEIEASAPVETSVAADDTAASEEALTEAAAEAAEPVAEEEDEAKTAAPVYAPYAFRYFSEAEVAELFGHDVPQTVQAMQDTAAAVVAEEIPPAAENAPTVETEAEPVPAASDAALDMAEDAEAAETPAAADEIAEAADIPAAEEAVREPELEQAPEPEQESVSEPEPEPEPEPVSEPELVSEPEPAVTQFPAVPGPVAEVIPLYAYKPGAREEFGLKDFQSSISCQWKEVVDNREVRYSVVCYEGEPCLHIETSSHPGATTVLSFDGMRRLLQWVDKRVLSS